MVFAVAHSSVCGDDSRFWGVQYDVMISKKPNICKVQHEIFLLLYQ